jgi:predicted Rossmann fold flavoprotein
MNENTEAPWDIIVVGAGAAGLMAAITAARRESGLQVLALDGARKIGAKILVSGGNRCNVTNQVIHPSRFHTESDPAGEAALKGDGAKSFVGRVLRAFSPDATRAFFEGLGVPLKLEPTGKYFPVSNSSRTVLNALVQEFQDAGATLKTSERVESISHAEGLWSVRTRREDGSGSVYESRAVILCSGGKALPRSGSDGAGYGFAEQFGHSVIRPTPALTPLMSVSEAHHRAPMGHLAGLTMDVGLSLRHEERVLCERSGSFLWTHVGFSGPVALNISRHVARRRWEFPRAGVFARWLPEVAPEDEGRWMQEFVRANAKKSVANALKAHLPERLANELGAPFDGVALGKLDAAKQKLLRQSLFAQPIPVARVDGYVKAEATAGGVSLAEIEPATMMSKKQEGLFLAGEVCDVDGWLGGYNFQWAWSSGVVAGRAAARFAAKALAPSV